MPPHPKRPAPEDVPAPPAQNLGSKIYYNNIDIDTYKLTMSENKNKDGIRNELMPYFINLSRPGMHGPFKVITPAFRTSWPLLHADGELIPKGEGKRQFTVDARFLDPMPEDFLDVDPDSHTNAKDCYEFCLNLKRHVLNGLYELRNDHDYIAAHVKTCRAEASETAMEMLARGELLLEADSAHPDIPGRKEWIEAETKRLFYNKANTAVLEHPKPGKDGTPRLPYVMFIKSTVPTISQLASGSPPKYTVVIYGPDKEEVDRGDENVQVIYGNAVIAIEFMAFISVTKGYYGVKFRMNSVFVYDQGSTFGSDPEQFTTYDSSKLKPMNVPDVGNKRPAHLPSDEDMVQALQQVGNGESTFVPNNGLRHDLEVAAEE